MTLSATYEPRRQQGNGITKEFSYSFDPYSPEALKVYIEENGVQSETQDYTATVSENGGIVTFNVAPTSEQYVVITRSVPQDQEVPFYTSSGFDAGVVENSLDKLTAMIQEVGNETLRSAKLPKGYNINLELPVPESGKGLYWNNEGTGFQNSRLNLDDVEALTKSYRDQAVSARDEAVASSTRAVNTVKEATDLLANTQTYVGEAIDTINTAVEDAKTTISETSEEAKETINSYVTNAEEEVRSIAQEEANKAIEDAAAAATEIATNNIQPLVDEAVNKAEEAINNADDAENSAIASRVWATGEDAEVEEIASGKEEHSSRGYADLAMAIANTPEDVPLSKSKLMALNIIKGPKGDKGDRGENGKDGKNGTNGEGLEIGDIGFAPFGIDESQNKRRYLNGQVISQAQFVSFTNKVKASIQLTPSLATSETNWQAEVTNSVNGTCGKFVIDDEAGTIRLPKYPEYVSKEYVEAAVVGNGKNIVIDYTLYGEAQSGTLANLYYGTNGLVGVTGGETSTNGIGITTDPEKSGIVADLKNATTETIPCKWYIQVALGVNESVDVTREIELNNPFSLLDYKWSEYELSNASWLLSNGAFHSGTVYKAVYELLLRIHNGAETKDGVSVKLSTEAYTDTDFVLNTADTTFRLPIKVKLASGSAVVGNGKALMLTNGTETGALSACGSGAGGNVAGFLRPVNGADGINIGDTAETTLASGFKTDKAIGVVNDPLKSGIETSSSGLKLYFYVGETVQDANVIVASRVLDLLANIDYVVESKVATESDPTWYRVYKSGWIEQGGTVPAYNGSRTIKLPKPYKDLNYSVSGSYYRADSGDISSFGYSFNVNQKQTDLFVSAGLFLNENTHGFAGGDVEFWSWEAKGQGA